MSFIYKKVLIFILILALSGSAVFCQGQIKRQKKETQNISLDVKNMNVIDVLKILADEGNLSLSINGNVKGRITLFLKDIEIMDALEIVLVSGNLAYEKKGKVFNIMMDRDYELKYGKKFWDKKYMEIFNLKNAKAHNVKQMLSQVVSSIGKIIVDTPTNTLVVIDTPENIGRVSDVVAKIDRALETKVFELDYLTVENAEKEILSTLTEGVGVLKTDETTNKIVVIDYPEKLKEIEKMIEAFDEKPLQVLIYAKIIELRPSRKFYSGIDWDYWIKKYFKTTGTFALPTSETDNLLSFGAGVAAAGASVGAVGEYAGTIEFLQIFGRTNILSSPRILVLNNHEAKIMVGTKDAYITSSTSQTTGTAVTSQEVNYVDVGVKLYVTPTINKKGYITLKLRPEISSAEREDIITDDKTTQVPIVTTSEAETSVIVKDGVSIIIGGLRKLTRAKERKQIPILGDIPLLGMFFRSEKDEWTKNELVIILTPYIISGDMPIEQELYEKLEGEMGESQAIEEFKKEEPEDVKYWRLSRENMRKEMDRMQEKLQMQKN